MKLIFFDTEFTDLAADAKLISIGLVDETGEKTFYAEFADTWSEDDASDFVLEVVVPYLEGGSVCMPIQDVRVRLKAWLESLNGPVQLATDSLEWDWGWIIDLFGSPDADTWPANLDHQPFLLTINYLNRFDEFLETVEKVFAEGRMRQHHALDDAKVNRLAWLASQKL